MCLIRSIAFRRRHRSACWMTWLVTGVVCVFLAGCGEPAKMAVHGTVTVGGQRPDSGEILFVPLQDTPGALNVAKIVDGQYAFKARGGLPPGKFQVRIRAFKKTGRMAKQNDDFEPVIEEQVRISPEVYAGDQSPLTQEIAPDSDRRIDIDI